MTDPAPDLAALAEAHDPSAWRARFPILEGSTYLVTHSLGAMPAAVGDRLREFTEQWASRGVRAWGEGWWDLPVTVGDLVGQVMNAPPGTVVMHQNVSLVQALVASALDFSGPRNKVVYTDQNFPTCMYVWEAHRDLGARLEVVPSGPEGAVPLERLLEAIDEETLIVPLSHVCFRNSFLQDARAVVERAHEVGALVLLDTYQSMGTVPIDVQALGVDMVCGGSVKWLLGGPGAAYLYVRPDLRPRLRPRVTGWAAHAEPFGFEPGAQRYAEGPEALTHGTPAVACLVQAMPGYEAVLEVGVPTIRAWSIRLLEGLRADLAERGFRCFGPERPELRGGTLTVRLAEDEHGPAFVEALAARGVIVDFRPEAGIRVSPHFYTEEDELRAFAEHLDELRRTGAWRDFLAGARRY